MNRRAIVVLTGVFALAIFSGATVFHQTELAKRARTIAASRAEAAGAPPPEASGVESVLAGLRDTVADDDQLLERACAVFDGLLASFRSNGSTA